MKINTKTITIGSVSLLAVLLIGTWIFFPEDLDRFLFHDNHDEHSESKDDKVKGHDDHGEDHDKVKEHDDRKKEGHDEHEEEIVRLSDAEIKEFKIKLSKANPGNLEVYINLPGEVRVNADRLAHVFPRVSGVVREVSKDIGDLVHSGEVMAVLESRELAEAGSRLLAARERVKLSRATYKREKTLWRQEISSEQDYLNAKHTLAQARIEVSTAEQKLHALGLSEGEILSRLELSHHSLTRYKITAPFTGTVIEKHISLGEALKVSSKMFVIADLSSVWIDLSVYRKDLPFVKEGQSVIISTGHGIPDRRGKIYYIASVVGEKTRTAIARVILKNRKRLWKPGLFVTAKVVVKSIKVPILIPKSALQVIEGKTQVFVKTKKGFEPRPITIGQSNETHVEVTSGLKKDQEVVTKGAFTLKSQLAKSEFSSGHSH